jgi:hypothetical protein
MLKNKLEVIQSFKLEKKIVKVESLELMMTIVKSYDSIWTGKLLSADFENTTFTFGQSKSIELALPVEYRLWSGTSNPDRGRGL